MSPYGFGGTRDLAGTPCWPDYAGSGGGTASPEMVRRIAAGDTGTDDPASPRNVLTSLYVKPPVQFAPGVEDALVDEILAMAIGDGNYPGDQTTSANWPGTAPGEHGVNNAISPRSARSSTATRRRAVSTPSWHWLTVATPLTWSTQPSSSRP